MMRRQQRALALVAGAALAACNFTKIVVVNGDGGGGPVGPTAPSDFGCNALTNTLELRVEQGLAQGGKALVDEPFVLRVIARDAAGSEVPTVCRGLTVEATGTDGVCAPTGYPSYTSITVHPFAPGQCSVGVTFQGRQTSINLEVIPKE